MTTLRSLAVLLALALPIAAQQTVYSVRGTTSELQLGWLVQRAGDLDGDARDDFLIGMPSDLTNGPDAGRVLVLSGRDGTTVLLDRLGDDAGDRFGHAAAAAGDVDADGFGDVVVGSYLDDDGGVDAGRVRVYSGATGAVLHTFDGAGSGAALGYSVAGAGDVDADGHDDVLVGTPFDSVAAPKAGAAFVYSGRTGAILHTFRGGAAGDLYGFSVTGAGDVDDDGHDDVLIGAIGDDTVGSDAGMAEVRSGRDGTRIHLFLGSGAGVCMGCAVARAGFVDGDRRSELLIGVRFGTGAVPLSGSVEVYDGNSGGLVRTFGGTTALKYFGSSVSGGGDLDGDGADDILIGEPFADSNGIRSGSVHAYSGATGTLLFTVTGDAPFDQLGHSVSHIGDIDNDQFADFAAGAPYDDQLAFNGGLARVYRSSSFTGSPSWVRRRLGGCSGSNGARPAVRIVERTTLGRAITIELRGATPGRLAFLGIGLRQRLDLTGFGAPGCFLLVDALVSSSGTVNPGGFLRESFTIPNVPAAVGVNLHTQWIVYDPGTNPLALAASHGLFFTVGS